MIEEDARYRHLSHTQAHIWIYRHKHTEAVASRSQPWSQSHRNLGKRKNSQQAFVLPISVFVFDCSYFKGWLMSFIWSWQAEDKQRFILKATYLPTHHISTSGTLEWTHSSASHRCATFKHNWHITQYVPEGPLSLLLSLYIDFQGSSLPSMESSKSSDRLAKAILQHLDSSKTKKQLPSPYWEKRKHLLLPHFQVTLWKLRGSCNGLPSWYPYSTSSRQLNEPWSSTSSGSWRDAPLYQELTFVELWNLIIKVNLLFPHCLCELFQSEHHWLQFCAFKGRF